jgi:hypothetical protein
MRDQSPYGTDAAPEQLTEAQLDRPRPDADEIGSPERGNESALPAMRRVWAALAWTVGGAVLFALFLRITRSKGVNSDAANNALQAYDMLHGHLLLHGWIIGDATYYTFELPLIAFIEIFFGLHTVTMNVAEALVYLIVAACAVAIAVTGSRGTARAARAAVVVAVLAAPALIGADMWIPLGIPDHTGTTVFLLVSCLLVDRVPARWFTAPVICLILAAGQIGDVTVRFVAVPAIVAVCAYRVLASRKLRTCDAANLLGAAASIPLSLGVRAAMLHYGAYLMVAPKTRIAPVSAWGHNAVLAWGALRQVFGAQAGPNDAQVGTIVIFGYACLVVTAIGILRVLWRWRSARRGEQVLLAAIAANLAVYILSTLPAPNSPHDIVAVLPSGAVLAARALVPERIAGRLVSLAAAGFAMVAALLPLTVIAAHAFQPPVVSPLAVWLEAHGLTYGLSGYWDSSSVALQTGNQVQVRTFEVATIPAVSPIPVVSPVPGVTLSSGLSPVSGLSEGYGVTSGQEITFYPWETNTFWFDPTRHYANFVVVDLAYLGKVGRTFTHFFGKPESTDIVDGNWEVLIYTKNLLTDVLPAPLPPTS